MINRDDAYNELARLGVQVFPASFEAETALAAPEGYLAIDSSKIESAGQELEILLHEIGHFETASFYQLDSPFAHREKQEGRANRFVFEKYYPPRLLAALMRQGHTAPWQLAEQLGLTERFVGEMLAFYTGLRGVDFNTFAAEQDTPLPDYAPLRQLLANRLRAGDAALSLTGKATPADAEEALRVIGSLGGHPEE